MTAETRAAMHNLSIAQWENERSGRVSALARALTALEDAGAALPRVGVAEDVGDDIARAHAGVRIALRDTMNERHPFGKWDG
jgi:hypothetical protein